MVEKIILVFKTHFDIGFTDLSRNVIRDYGDQMLRQVIETCRATEDLGRLRYVWTMPAWPLWYISEHCAPELRPELDRLIGAGQIVWHGLPFTSHTDLCAPEEYAQGLRYARELFRKYHKPLPLAAKMTDVPGHGEMLPQLLSQAGIRFLHLGCNEFATPPQVPELFFWEGAGGGRVLTMYSGGGYGTSLLPPKDWPHQTWMALMHTHDNCGPQSADMIRHMAEQVHEAYPEVQVQCGSMDDFWNALSQEDLSGVPTVKGDLADTWIHGVSSYPKETAELRENRELARRLQERYLEQMIRDQAAPELEKLWNDYYEEIALYEEHTWGADVKTWLGPDRVYEKEAFLKQRRSPKYRFMEESWQEQRDRMIRAGQILQAIQAHLPEAEKPRAPRTAKLQTGRAGDRMWLANHRYRLTFRPETGEILSLFDQELGDTLLRAGEEGSVFAYRYDRLGMEDMTAFLRSYGYHFLPWGIQDYGRENYPYCDRKTYRPEFTGYELADGKLTLQYRTDESSRAYGDAKRITLEITLPEEGQELYVELRLEGKQASPYLEAGSLILPLGGKAEYRIGKPGTEIDPRRDIVPCGNQALYNLEHGVQAAGTIGALQVASLDAPLFSLGGPGVFEFYRSFPENRGTGIWFNLFNNMWGTNFPQWIEGNLRYRFVLRGRDPQEEPRLEAWAARMCRGGEAAATDLALPEDVALVHAGAEGREIYVTLRNYRNETRKESLSLKGWKLTETDLLRRPLGEPKERLELTLEPLSLAMIRMTPEET